MVFLPGVQETALKTAKILGDRIQGHGLCRPSIHDVARRQRLSVVKASNFVRISNFLFGKEPKCESSSAVSSRERQAWE